MPVADVRQVLEHAAAKPLGQGQIQRRRSGCATPRSTRPAGGPRRRTAAARAGSAGSAGSPSVSAAPGRGPRGHRRPGPARRRSRPAAATRPGCRRCRRCRARRRRPRLSSVACNPASLAASGALRVMRSACPVGRSMAVIGCLLSGRCRLGRRRRRVFMPSAAARRAASVLPPRIAAMSGTAGRRGSGGPRPAVACRAAVHGSHTSGDRRLGCRRVLRRAGSRPARPGGPHPGDVDRLAVRDRHQPGRHVGVGGQVGIGPQRREEGLRPGVVGIDRTEHGATTRSTVAPCVGHDLLERRLGVHHRQTLAGTRT